MYAKYSLLLTGSTPIDIKDWMTHTNYNGFVKSDLIIVWFSMNICYSSIGGKIKIFQC